MASRSRPERITTSPSLSWRSASSSIIDDTGPNTRPNEHANKIVASPPRSIQVFTKGSNLNIVSNSNRFAKLLVEDASKRHIFHAQVWGVHDDSCFTIDLSCGADTNRNNARAVRKSCIVERHRCNFDRSLCYKVLPFLGASTFAL